MRIFYDTEFLERGPGEPITLVSIGMVREDGEEYYAVNGDLTAGHLSIMRNDPWLGPNVYAHLPMRPTVSGPRSKMSETFDYDHPDVKPFVQIGDEVSNFCLTSDLFHELSGKAELWAYYADYDHVVLSQLFGRMIDLPGHLPMYTRDLKQVIDMLDLDVRVGADGADHHALADARGVAVAWSDARDLVARGYGVDL